MLRTDLQAIFNDLGVRSTIDCADDSRLVEDLGMDSLHFAELLDILEWDFKLAIEDPLSLETVGDILRLVEKESPDDATLNGPGGVLGV